MAVQAMVFDLATQNTPTPQQASKLQALENLKQTTLSRIQKIGYEVIDISEGQMTAWQLKNSYQQVQIYSLEELIHFSQTQVPVPVQPSFKNNNLLEIGIMLGILAACALASYFITLA